MSAFLKQAIEPGGYSWLGAGLTTTFLVCFSFWIVWAWWPGNKARLDAAARMPLDDDSHPV